MSQLRLRVSICYRLLPVAKCFTCLDIDPFCYTADDPFTLKDCQQFGDILHIILWKGRHEVNLSKLAVGNLALNLVNYSVLHIDIGLILVGMIANISDCKDTIFLSNNNVFSLENKFSWLKKASLLSFKLHLHKILFVVSTF